MGSDVENNREDLMDSETNHRDPPPGGQESSVEEWQAKVDRLQELVCILLMKNQTMRAALLTEMRNEENKGTI
jgi:hypothetical protein